MHKLDKGIGRYSSPTAPLVDHMEVVPTAKCAKARAKLDLLLGWKAAAFQLEDLATEIVGLPKTGGGYFLSGRDCSSQTGHYDFKQGNTRNPAILC